MHGRVAISLSVFILTAVVFGCAGEETVCGVVPSEEASSQTSIVINEVMAKSLDGTPDFVEVFNKGTSDVDIGCWSVIDKSSKNTPFFLPRGTILEPGGFHVVVRDKTGASGFTWGFAMDGDTARLRDEGGRAVDDTRFDAGQAQAGNSWGRHPDGTGEFATLTEPTLGAPNAAPDSNPPVRP